jgi:hypothetical protein
MDGGQQTSGVLRRIPAADWLRGLGAALLLGGLSSFVLPGVVVGALAVLAGVGAMVLPWRAAAAQVRAHPPQRPTAPPTTAERFMKALKTVGDFREQANGWYLREEAMPTEAWDVLCDELLDWANKALKFETAARLAGLIDKASPKAPSSDNRRCAGELVASLLEFQRSLANAEVL